MTRRCYIAGAGEFCENTLPGHNDYIIAADGGYAALTSFDINPDMIVGDFDSLKPELLETALNHPNVVRSPVEKDDTDMMLAAFKGLELGYNEFIINGGLGGRLDQTFANIQLLGYLLENNAHGYLLGNNIIITAIKNGELLINPPNEKENNTISVFCHGETAQGVYLQGLMYPLENATITGNYPIGVSNEFTGAPAKISVKKGTLILMWYGGLTDICKR